MELNITPELKELAIIVLITGIAFYLIVLLLILIFHIREKKTGKRNPLFKEWP